MRKKSLKAQKQLKRRKQNEMMMMKVQKAQTILTFLMRSRMMMMSLKLNLLSLSRSPPLRIPPARSSLCPIQHLHSLRRLLLLKVKRIQMMGSNLQLHHLRMRMTSEELCSYEYIHHSNLPTAYCRLTLGQSDIGNLQIMYLSNYLSFNHQLFRAT